MGLPRPRRVRPARTERVVAGSLRIRVGTRSGHATAAGSGAVRVTPATQGLEHLPGRTRHRAVSPLGTGHAPALPPGIGPKASVRLGLSGDRDALREPV